jgi:ABC-type glycerol-3-phosphate transport system permease component
MVFLQDGQVQTFPLPAFRIVSQVEICAICPLGVAMVQLQNDLTQMSLEDIAEAIKVYAPGSAGHTQGLTEFARRQTQWQIEASLAQMKAANEAGEANETARKNANYILWSVIIAAVSAFGSALSAALTAYSAWPKK